MNNYNLNNHVIFVTGAAGQLGQSIVNGLIRCEANVICTDLDIKNLKKISIQNSWNSQVTLLEVNVSDKSSVEDAFKNVISKFGRVDALVNNAGISVFEPWFDRTENDFDAVINVNMKGAFLCMREFFKYNIQLKNLGSVVNIASHYGIVSPDPRIYTDCDRRNSEVYGASKAGLIQMTKYFAVNAIHDGATVRVNAIAPGGVLNEKNPQGKDFQKLYSQRCPIGRMAHTNEIVGPVLFLLSEDASYINGHTIVVDGGMTSW